MSEDSKRKVDQDASRVGGAAQPLDPERLAALLDGRLDTGERERLLAAINESDDAFEILVEASAALQPPIEEPDSASPYEHVDRRLPRRSKLRPLRWLAVAAGVAGVALAPWGWSALRGNRFVDPGRFAAAVSPTAEQLASTVAARPWSVNRGPSLRDAARAARVGVYVTDIDLASRLAMQTRATAPVTVDQLITELLSLLASSVNAGAAVQAYTEVRDQRDDSLRVIRIRNARAAAMAIDPANVEAGAWAEAALYAVMTRDSAFFGRAETTQLLAHRIGSDSAIARELQSTVRATPLRWDALAEQVRRLLIEITD